MALNNTITITVNGIKHSFTDCAGENLLFILREKLDLMGAKEGCGYGKCGSCTVVMNGEAVTACTIRGKKMENAEITTIEGISDGFELHPIQKAFIDAFAIQCGFCTPGIVLKLYALFNKHIDATQEEIKEALTPHLCRCTGYETIWEASLLAQKRLKEKVISK